MRLDFNNSIANTVEGDVQLSIGDPRVVISILTEKLYSTPIQTSVKEYISNAIDAHREIGQTKRIKITTPNRLNNNKLSIRDFGPGMSPQQMKDVFMSLGTSTKRNSNSFIGGFGIGSKSFASFSSACQIETWHEGTYYNYLCSLVDGMIQLKLLKSNPSDEPSGLKITLTIPKDVFFDVKQIVKFMRPEEMPEIDGQVPDALEWIPFIFRGRKLEYAIMDDYHNQVVIDNFAYPINGSRHPVFQAGVKVRLPMDMAKINPNRETIAEIPELILIGDVISDKMNKKYYVALQKHLETKGPFEAIPQKIFGLKSPVGPIYKDIEFKHNGFSFVYEEQSGTIRCEEVKMNTVNPSYNGKLFYLEGRKANYKPALVYSVPNITRVSKTFFKRIPRANSEVVVVVEENNPRFLKAYGIQPLSIFKKKPNKKNGNTGKDLKDEVRYTRLQFGTPSFFKTTFQDILDTPHPIYWIPFKERPIFLEKYGLSMGYYPATIVLLTKAQQAEWADKFLPLEKHYKKLKALIKTAKDYTARNRDFEILLYEGSYLQSDYSATNFFMQVFKRLGSWQSKSSNLFGAYYPEGFGYRYIPMAKRLRKKWYLFYLDFANKAMKWLKKSKDHSKILYALASNYSHTVAPQYDGLLDEVMENYGDFLMDMMKDDLEIFDKYYQRIKPWLENTPKT